MTQLHQVSPSLTCVISTGVGPPDREALLELFARGSAQRHRDRFPHALSVFPESYLDDILCGRTTAVIARDACHAENFGKVIGLASAASTEPGTAEISVWVDDAWQRHGVGGLLTRTLVRQLVASGISTAIGVAEPADVAVRQLVARLAPNATVRAEDGVLVISVPLAR